MELGDLGGVCAGGDLYVLVEFQAIFLFLYTHCLEAQESYVPRELTWDSAGAHRARVAWRMHCRAGAAKERAANMLRVFQGCHDPIAATRWW